RVGRRIGSAALVADGLHARTDGLTSLAVIAAAAGSWFGFPLLDPLVGFAIAFAIVGITWNAIKAVWYRLMDAVDPDLIHRMEHGLDDVPSVSFASPIRARWVGHRLYADFTLKIPKTATLAEANQLAAEVRHAMKHRIPQLQDVSIQTVAQE
ncbi:MAG: cation diffusion facilitator family transporter, partial [Anaerolineae bacterium]|nr:cation diffusion facilitator family transporter [Anaerolineae bacterium]